MEEKKLTDEEIVEALEHCEDCVGCAHCVYTHKEIDCNSTNDALDLIHRLQAENTKQKADIELLTKVLGSSKRKTKILNLQREIERLTEREKFLENAWKTSLEHTETVERGLKASEARTAELQKQVDELKNRFENKARCNMSENCSMVQQAVKDTAKDILIEFNEWINGQYDAKLDTYSVHIPVQEVNDFLTDKAKEYGVEVE